jgi:hypothetical protein
MADGLVMARHHGSSNPMVVIAAWITFIYNPLRT